MHAQEKTAQPKPDPRRHLSLTKRDHEFRFSYAAGDEAHVLQALAEMADDAAESLDWFDAAVLSHQLGEHLGGELDELLPEPPTKRREAA